jgi:endo-1,4-beta-xylanase
MAAGLVAQKKIAPVICVFPNGGMSGYRDRPDEKAMGETLIIKELIPLIDKQYRTIAKPEGRTIAGFSMGGGGAVRLAIKHPDLFSAAASWAAAIRFREDDPSFQVERLSGLKDRVRLLMIVGEKDQTRAGHAPLLERLQQAKLPVEYQELPDVGHDLGKYYELTGEKLVTFVASGFTKSSSGE